MHKNPPRRTWLHRWPLGPYAGSYVLLLGLLVLLLPPSMFAADRWLWVRWADYSRAHGLGNVYAVHGNNYNPLYHYLLWLFGRWQGSLAAIDAHAHWLKLLTLPFDVGGALLAASLARTDRRRFVASLWLLLNGAYLYNTLIWGQVDAIYTALVLAAVLLVLRGRLVWGAVAYTLALCAKLQALIFLPGLVLLVLPALRWQPRRVLGAALAALLALALVLLPFAVGGERSYLDVIWRLNRQAVGYYPFLSMRAYNWWYLTTSGELMTRLDTDLWHGLSYRRWGMLLFCAASTVVLWPLLRQAWRAWQERTARFDTQRVLLSLALIPLVFCFFNTQMHERYWHAAVLLSAACWFAGGRGWLFGLTSVAYLLNLEAVMDYLGLVQLVPGLFRPELVAALFALAIGVGVGELYGWPGRCGAAQPA